MKVGDLVRYESRSGKILVGVVTEIDPSPYPFATECYVDGMKQWLNNKFLERVPEGWVADTSHIGA